MSCRTKRTRSPAAARPARAARRRCRRRSRPSRGRRRRLRAARAAGDVEQLATRSAPASCVHEPRLVGVRLVGVDYVVDDERADPCRSSRADGARARRRARRSVDVLVGQRRSTTAGRGRAPRALSATGHGTSRNPGCVAEERLQVHRAEERARLDRRAPRSAADELVARRAELVLDDDRVHPVDVPGPRLARPAVVIPGTSASARCSVRATRRFSVDDLLDLRAAGHGPSPPGSRSSGSCSRPPRGGSAAA